jgi:superfamily II DNA or RNA helicase
VADDLPFLLQRIRKKCTPALWSRGVNLVRGEAVVLESRGDEEIVVRVRAPGRPVALCAVLYPTMSEWECDCDGRVSPCDHVAAAAILLAKLDAGPEAGAAPEAPDAPAGGEATRGGPTASPQQVTNGGTARGQAKPVPAALGGQIAYRFRREPGGGLRVARSIRQADGAEAPLTGRLSALLSQPSEARRLQIEQHDLQADLLLGAGAGAILPATKVEALVRVLQGARFVSLDGVAVSIADDEALPRAEIHERGSDLVVRVLPDPRVREVLGVGVGLADDTLCRLGELELAGPSWQHLPMEQVYPPERLGDLITRALPDLSRRMQVDVRTRRLPRVARGLRPRVVVEVNRIGAGLSALPRVVYGSPACARIDDGRLVHLGGPVPVRDEDAEKRLVFRLRDELNLVPGRRASFEGADAARFTERLRRFRGDLTGDAAGVVRPTHRLEPRLSVTAGASGDVSFDLSFALLANDTSSVSAAAASERPVDAETVLAAWRDDLGLVPLLGGGWAPLPSSWLREHGQRLADLLAARGEDGKLATHALPTLADFCQELEHPAPPGLDRLAPLVEGFEALPAAALPEDLRAELRPYQRRGVDWLAFLRGAGLGAVLADDMGLGKTLQTLCALPAKGRTLIVCPTSVLHNWRAEIARFRPALATSVYHGPGRSLDAKASVTLTSYALLRLDAQRLSGTNWDAVVLDEAHTIKNPDSQVARAAYGLRARFRVALTGTPVENRLEELWSLTHFTNRGLLGGRGDFDDRFARPIAEGGRATAEELRRRIRPFVLRRTKAEVAPDLPPRTEAVLSVELDARERATYDAIRAATQKDLLALLEGGKGVMAALEALLRLRQAACHAALVPGQVANTSSKVERLVDALATAVDEGHKALVFSQWTSLLDLVEPALSAAGLRFTRLDGSTQDREGVVNTFQSAEGPPVMLLSLKAGGTGLNLTAADHVFLLDPWWNPAVEAQAADRAHRIGQDKPVVIYRMVAVDTVEERILALQERKRQLAAAALEDAGAAAALTRDDLLALLV